jgi:c-di-GMP-binding flagellar brake protein YcgR
MRTIADNVDKPPPHASSTIATPTAEPSVATRRPIKGARLMMRPALWFCEILPGHHGSPASLHAALTVALFAAASCMIACCCVLIVVHVLRNKHDRERKAAAGIQQGAELISPKAVEIGTRVAIDLIDTDCRRSGHGTMRAVTGRYVELDVEPRLLPARIGAPLQVMLTSPTAAYRFHSYVVDHRADDGRLIIIVSRPPWLERVQRRRNFRIPCELPAILAPVPAQIAENPCYRCTIYDLSATGMSLGTPIEFDTGRVLRVPIPIPEGGEMPVEMKVVRISGARCTELPYTLHCEFASLPDESRNELMRQCFEMEMRLLRNRRDRRAPRAAA